MFSLLFNNKCINIKNNHLLDDRGILFLKIIVGFRPSGFSTDLTAFGDVLLLAGLHLKLPSQ